MDSWSRYVRELTRGESQNAAGKRIGVDGSTVHRWRNGARPGAGEVAALAMAYDGNVLEAFVAAGYLTPEQAGMPPKARPDWATVTNEELLEQVAARLQPDTLRRHRARSEPVSAPADSASVDMAAQDGTSIAEEQEARNEP